VLAVLEYKTLTIEVFDSMNSYFSQCKDKILAVFQKYRSQLQIPAGNFKINNVSKQHQTEGHNCGVFVCYYILLKVYFRMNSTDIVNNVNANSSYMTNIMRPYLIQQLSDFPQILQIINRTKKPKIVHS